MPQYVCLVTFTQEGLKNLKATTKRAKAFADKVQELWKAAAAELTGKHGYDQSKW